MIQQKRSQNGSLQGGALRMLRILAVLTVVLTPFESRAGTIIHFDTNVADFDVELFDSTMPITVANFLSYVNAGSYSSSLIHRSTTYNPNDIQIVQGGGFELTNNQILPITTNPSIVLESGNATNVRGTLAMARGSATDSATSQYFFNIQNNPALDGNYAVFGTILGAEGLIALDAIGAVPVYDASAQLGSTFAEMPLIFPSLVPSSLVLVNSITVVPEPSTMTLLIAGLIALFIGKRADRNPVLPLPCFSANWKSRVEALRSGRDAFPG